MSDETELTEGNFASKTSKGNWVVDFWAAWCIPCKIMAPHFAAAAKEMKGKVHFGKVDVDAEGALAEQFDIVSIPTTLFMKEGEVVNRISGAMPKDELMKAVKESF
ncbi:MAG TPA: thioredoxin [Candidatus Nanoarchaeia archaeon]|nr:thioredoxin [Candidatus Nanoarchaeia archaeon]